MKVKKNLSDFLIWDILAMAVLYLLPDNAGNRQLKGILFFVLAIAALTLLFMISRKKEKKLHVRIIGIDAVSQMNPGQYLSKGGPVCAGSDCRYHVSFLQKDDTQLILSLSAKQAGSLAIGMCGTLFHNGSVFIGFTPE